MNIKDFLKQTENGTFDIDEAGFIAALDRERSKASDTASKNTESKLRTALEKEIREKLEEEAKLSAEQKLQKQMDDFAEMKRNFDRERVKAIYEGAGIGAEETELLLTLIGDDSEKNLENAKKFADARKKANEDNEKRIREELLRNNGDRPDGNGDKGEVSEAEKYAKMFSKPVTTDYVEL